ncbi:MAG: N-acetylmuramoyl-L-alanine amidase [Lentisphaeria bacterium]|nr:N-acetylmuramoyl-L-alanine amidase [Lentisphaeria bacterium]
MRFGYLFKIFILILMMFSAVPLLNSAAAAPAQRINYVKINNLQYVKLDDVAKYYQMAATYRGDTITLTRGKVKLIFTVDKRDAKINNSNVILAYAVLKNSGKYYLSQNDFLGTVDPLIRAGAVKYHKIDHILIDPGHGGKDKGAVRGSYVEKDLTLQIAKKLRTKLQQAGYKVSMTRTDDSNLTLNERVAKGERLKADLVISIHLNTAANNSVSGIESYSIPAYKTPPSNSNKNMTKKVNGHRNEKNSLALAFSLHRALLSKTNATDRGVKRMNFLVLRESKIPIVLIECGFISNRIEAWRLKTSSYQDKLADGIVKGVKDYKARLLIPKKK